MITIKVSLPTWRSNGLVFIEKDVEKFKKVALTKHKLDIQMDLKDAAGLALTDDPSEWVIWLSDGHNMPELTHEAFHVTSCVLRHRGVVLSDDSEEAFAYTLTDIVTQITRGIGRSLRKGIKKR